MGIAQAQERLLERYVSDAQRAVDAAKAEHRRALAELRKYRKAKLKAEQSNG